MKRISGPWCVFESLTLFKELHDCLHTHYAPEYHNRVLFFHPQYIGVKAYKEMTHEKLKQYTIIIMTLESYMTMVFDYDFQEESAIYGELTDGTQRLLGYGQCTYEQVIGREKYKYTGTAAMMAVHFDGVIIDESHVIRNGNTSRSTALTTIARLFNFIFSGDPLVNSSNDFYNQLRFLGYKGASSLKDWEENLNYLKRRDNLLEDPNVTDRSDATAPIKEMTIAKDAPYLMPPPLNKEEVMLTFEHEIEKATNQAMTNIMVNLINAANNNKINKKYIFAFFTFQNLTKIAPYLISTASKRKNYKYQIFTEDDGKGVTNKTIIGDDAFNSYFTDEMIESVLKKPVSTADGETPTFLSAPAEDAVSEEEAIEIGTSIMSKVMPFVMSDLISDIQGPAGMGSTTMQWIVSKVRWIMEHGEPNAKVIIGTNYTAAADLISQTLERDVPNACAVQVDGSVRGNHRNKIITKFQTDPKCRVLVINSKIGAYGLNLTEANYVIDADGWYNNVPGNQLICRCWRPGQKRIVHAFQLFRKDTIDMHILKLRQGKQENIDRFWSDEGDLLEENGGGFSNAKSSNALDFDTIRIINNVQARTLAQQQQQQQQQKFHIYQPDKQQEKKKTKALASPKKVPKPVAMPYPPLKLDNENPLLITTPPPQPSLGASSSNPILLTDNTPFKATPTAQPANTNNHFDTIYKTFCSYFFPKPTSTKN